MLIYGKPTRRIGIQLKLSISFYENIEKFTLAARFIGFKSWPNFVFKGPWKPKWPSIYRVAYPIPSSDTLLNLFMFKKEEENNDFNFEKG